MRRKPQDQKPAPLNTSPVVENGHLHSHPLPKAIRITLVLYGLLLGITLASIVGLVYTTSHNADVRREADKAAIDKLLAERSAARDKKESARDAETRRRVCAVLANDLVTSINNTQLQLILGCVVKVGSPRPGSTTVPQSGGGTIQVVPVPGPAGATGATGPAGPQGAPAPKPSSGTSPSPAPRPTPKPSPTPTCGPVNTLVGRC